MATKLIATNGKATYEQHEYVCDEESDIEALPTSCGMGSVAYIIETAQYYVLNGEKKWVLSKNNTSSSDIDLTLYRTAVEQDMIDATKITAPSSPIVGAFLVWDGTAWVAQTLTTWQGGSY